MARAENAELTLHFSAFFAGILLRFLRLPAFEVL